MPVFLLTLHAYRSWNPDNPRGYVRRGAGVLPPNRPMAESYAHNATDPPASFGPQDQIKIANLVIDACERREWRLHSLATEPTHAHLLVSWRNNTSSTAVCAKLKNLISRELNLGKARKRKWLSRGASRKQIKDREHFDYLVTTYLPKHRGLVWVEGEGPPMGP